MECQFVALGDQFMIDQDAGQGQGLNRALKLRTGGRHVLSQLIKIVAQLNGEWSQEPANAAK